STCVVASLAYTACINTSFSASIETWLLVVRYRLSLNSTVPQRSSSRPGRAKPTRFLSILPTNHLHSVELHEGDWESDHIKFWEYSVGGKRETFKEKVEVDEANMTVKLIGLEGDPMKIYKVFNPMYKVEPKGQGTLATLSIEYEKVNENVPNPDNYVDFMVSHFKEIAAAIGNA
ncbi:hypothetical protein Tsubulata_045570, partial [Turnera subulata]